MFTKTLWYLHALKENNIIVVQLKQPHAEMESIIKMFDNQKTVSKCSQPEMLGCFLALANKPGFKQERLDGISGMNNSHINVAVTQDQQDVFTLLETLFQ